ncbi:metallophosphoesterase [Arcobacter sp. FWKO B]|nr:metallophosphoesterase [Arcobacter sp. FWKO B]
MIPFIFPIIFLLVFALMLFYSKKRFIDKTTFSKKAKKILISSVVIIYIFVIAYFINRFYPFLPQPLYYIATLSQGIGFIIFVFTLFFEIYLFVTKFVKISENKKQIIEIILFVGMIFYISIGILNGQKDIQISEHTYTTQKPLQKELKVVFFSDLHIGGLVDTKYVKSLVSKINATNADIILIGGDLIDTRLDDITKELNILKDIKSTYGTYFIVGNHEYFHNLTQIIQTSKELGFIPLLNETIYIDELGIQISGIYDYLGKRRDTFSPDLNILDIDQEKYSILVSHQPKVVVDEDFDANNFDLILSGHTHCGQIAPFGFLVLLDQPYLCGEIKISHNSNLLISAGAGFWGPKMRIGSQYEIHLINIK